MMVIDRSIPVGSWVQPGRVDVSDAKLMKSVSAFSTARADAELIQARVRTRLREPWRRLRRALQRAIGEPGIRAMIDVPDLPFAKAKEAFDAGRHAFILQAGHLTTAGQADSAKIVEGDFEYGITFIPRDYIQSHWGRWFDIVDYRSGAFHDFQDLAVLRCKSPGIGVES